MCPTLCDPMDWHGVMPQHARFLCPPLSPGVCSNSCPLSQWCYLTISFSITPFCSCHQSFPVPWSFTMSLLFALSGQKMGALAFSNRPSNGYSGLISFRIDWFDLAVQGTFSSLFQHNSKASILWRSAFFMVQLSHSYVTTGKTIALTIQTFVYSKVMPLFFNILSRFLIDFLLRSKYILISWL